MITEDAKDDFGRGGDMEGNQNAVDACGIGIERDQRLPIEVLRRVDDQPVSSKSDDQVRRVEEEVGQERTVDPLAAHLGRQIALEQGLRGTILIVGGPIFVEGNAHVFEIELGLFARVVPFDQLFEGGLLRDHDDLVERGFEH